MPSKYGYSFDVAEGNTESAAFQLLRTSILLLSCLTPRTRNRSSKLVGYQSYSYGVDFVACLRRRNALHSLQHHLSMASKVASLTYQAVYAGSSTDSLAIIHNNAIDVVGHITTLVHTMTDSGSSLLELLLLLMENRCFQLFINNPLLKVSLKTWISGSSQNALQGDEAIPVINHHRGYSLPVQRHTARTSSCSNGRPLSESDPVHSIWRVVINIFSSLLRSARRQTQVHAKVNEHILQQLVPITNIAFDFLCTFEMEIFSCFSTMFNQGSSRENLPSKDGKAKPSSFSSASSSFAFTPNLLKEASDISMLFSELTKGDIKNKLSCYLPAIFKKLISSSLDLIKITSSFLGSIGSARELFSALSSASSLLFDQPYTLTAHPLLTEGIPNARHEAIRNAHFVSSCCIFPTVDDFSKSQIGTTKAVQADVTEESDNSSNLEKSFQIHVNNQFIVELEQVAGQCLFNALSVVSETHPSSDSFISFSTEEALHLDVATIMRPGVMVAISSQNTGAQTLRRYRFESRLENVRYARAIGCDRSTHSVSVEYYDSGIVEYNVPWSWLVGMEDTTKRQCVLLYSPAEKSVVNADTRGPTSVGHLILALRWCRHLASVLTESHGGPLLHLITCVAERAAMLLSTEVSLHDELGERKSHDEISRKVNAQLLDLFDYARDAHAEESEPVAELVTSKSLKSVINQNILDKIQLQLRRQLNEACAEREEERKMWEQNSGWETNTSFWGNSAKREGRRSPFRAFTRMATND